MRLLLLVLIFICPSLSIAGEQPLEYSIKYVCANGAGFKITKDGQISMIVKAEDKKGPVESPKEMRLGTDLNRTDDIFLLAENNGFLESSYDKGNCQLTYKSPTAEHVVRYSAKAPQPIKDIFNSLQVLYRSLAERKSL